MHTLAFFGASFEKDRVFSGSVFIDVVAGRHVMGHVCFFFLPVFLFYRASERISVGRWRVLHMYTGVFQDSYERKNTVI